MLIVNSHPIKLAQSKVQVTYLLIKTGPADHVPDKKYYVLCDGTQLVKQRLVVNKGPTDFDGQSR